MKTDNREKALSWFRDKNNVDAMQLIRKHLPAYRHNSLPHSLTGREIEQIFNAVQNEQLVASLDSMGGKAEQQPSPSIERVEELYRWVKASERLPRTWLFVPVRMSHTKILVHDIEEQLKNRPQFIHVIEWLERVEPQPQEQDIIQGVIDSFKGHTLTNRQQDSIDDLKQLLK